MALKRSDVLITRPCSMDVYRRFRATGLGWGFLPEPDRRGLPPDEEMMRDVDEAHRCGVIFQGRVELDADWMGMIDFDSNFMESTVRDLNDRPAVTWWEHTYKGHPSYHYCTNAPGYRQYLMYQLRRVMQRRHGLADDRLRHTYHWRAERPLRRLLLPALYGKFP